MVNPKTSPQQIKGLISSLDYAWTVQKPNQGETGSLMILTILFFLINQMVLTDLVKISLLAQTGPFWRNAQFALMSTITFFFQSLDEDYNILSKLKKSSKNVHAAGLSMFRLLFFFSAVRVHVLAFCIANQRVSLRLNAYLAPAQLQVRERNMILHYSNKSEMLLVCQAATSLAEALTPTVYSCC